jgi:hypothetical protein
MKKKQRNRELRIKNENRRLRERLRKDRMIADRRYRQVNRRVGAHDRVLGVETDTSDPASLIEDADNAGVRPKRTVRRRPGRQAADE